MSLVDELVAYGNMKQTFAAACWWSL